MARPAPTHVNQIDAGGRFPNGYSSAPYDCTVASAVMDLDAATGGRIRVSTTELRRAQDDQNRDGIGLDDVETAHRRLGFPGFSHGRIPWPALKRRLEARDGAILQGLYLALGSWRGSSFRGPHAMYVQAIEGSWAIVNDPIRRAPARIPVSALQAFYVSGLALAGWTIGGAVSSTTPNPTAPTTGLLAQFLATIGRRPTDPIRDQDVMPFVRFLTDHHLVPPGGPSNPLVLAVINTVRGMIGQPWTVAGQRFLAAAAASNPADAIGAAIGQAVGGLVGGLGEVFRNAIILAAILALVLIGLYLLATAPDNPLPRPRMPIGA